MAAKRWAAFLYINPSSVSYFWHFLRKIVECSENGWLRRGCWLGRGCCKLHFYFVSCRLLLTKISGYFKSFLSFFPCKLYQLSPSDEKRDNEVIIQECVQNFASRDFIMEPDIFNNIRRYQPISNICRLFGLFLLLLLLKNNLILY